MHGSSIKHFPVDSTKLSRIYWEVLNAASRFARHLNERLKKKTTLQRREISALDFLTNSTF